MILGIDTSTYLEELSHGARYYDGALEIDPLNAFASNGVNYMRIRVWNDPHSPEGEPYLACLEAFVGDIDHAPGFCNTAFENARELGAFHVAAHRDVGFASVHPFLCVGESCV